ncbi:hypothetical protein HK102_012494 [Quaeritorhiza haematococci]|nr:hypothetical protein HK102_012494 [Quaeritorhiza haematococci]
MEVQTKATVKPPMNMKTFSRSWMNFLRVFTGPVHSGELQQFLLPGLHVDGIGSIGLPLPERDAIVLTARYEQAPYGKGEATIVDTTVRKTWQLGPEFFSIRNPQWTSMVDNLVRGEIARDLGISPGTNVHATLYKLLLYETGGFFKPHRDTEKEDGMFATLVIMLPRAHEGGTLIVKHKNTTKMFDFSAQSEFGAFYTAFYCNCKHQIQPVTSGYRLCLVYNLCATNSAPPQPVNNEAQMEWGKNLLRYFADNESLFAYFLDHQYSLIGLTMASFKGADLAVVQLLHTLASELNLGMAFAQINLHDRGEGNWDPDEHDNMHEDDIYHTIRVAEWININGHVLVDAMKITLEASQIVPQDWYKHASPYSTEHEETGNTATAEKASMRNPGLADMDILIFLVS